MALRLDLALTLSDDGSTFLVETSDVAVTLPAGDVLGIMPDDVKRVLGRIIRAQARDAQAARDRAEADRAAALERRRAADDELASITALAGELPADPDPPADPPAE